jgi:hypothetical protein
MVLAVVVVSACAVWGGIALASSSSGTSPAARIKHGIQPRFGLRHHHHHPASGRDRTRSGRHTVSPALRNHFAIFAGRTRSQHLHAAAYVSTPPGVQSILESLGSPDDPSNEAQQLDTSQSDAVTGGAETVWVVPGGAGACVVSATAPPTQGPVAGDWGPFADCAHNAHIVSTGLYTVGTEDGDAGDLLVGLVPNGYPQVVVGLPDGSRETFEVTDNTISVNVPGFPTQIELETSTGATVSAMPIG